MKKKIKVAGIILVAFFCFVSTTLVFAESGNGDLLRDRTRLMDQTCISLISYASETGPSNNGGASNDSGATNSVGAMQETRAGSANNTYENESGNGDTLRERTRLMDQTCISLKEQLSNLESKLNGLESKYQTALKLQNESEAQAIKEQMQIMTQEKDECVRQLLQARIQLRELVRVSYSDEEMARIKAVEAELTKKYPADRVLPVENIITHGFTVKFDTPPVIRDGRTLVPVRALAEAMGATVEWNGGDRTVTIMKNALRIKLQLESRIAYVNGEKIILDVQPETINSRTVVPLRFILQQYGYDVEWDNESRIIAITEPQL